MSESTVLKQKKQRGKVWYVTLFLLLCMMGLSVKEVYAAKAGFVKIDGKTYYQKSNGTYVKGWMTLKNKRYFFDKSTGVMVTGWRINSANGKKRYFHATKGYMYTGWTKKMRYFDPSTGYLSSGFTRIDGKMYYFWPKNGVAATGWVKNPEGKYRYFSTKGVMMTGWTSTLRYFDLNTGLMCTGFQTVDDHTYYFNPSDGKAVTGWLKLGKKSYYFNANGSMQTGWTKIDSNWYYFNSKDGHMYANTTHDNIVIGSDGVAVTNKTEDKRLTKLVNSAKILIVSGHGMGDSGATSKIGGTIYQESVLTREFAKLIYTYLSKTDLRVTLYDQNYDLFQVNSGKKDGPMPKLTDYDYILEVHFNAMETPDLKGNGVYMGCGMMINSNKKKYTIDKNIIASIAKTGFAVWGRGDGIFKSSGLLNAKTCQSKGVSYGLLETAFIDDKDDMTFYKSHKKIMAKAVSDAIESYFD